MKSKCNVMQVSCVSVFITIVFFVFSYYVLIVVQQPSNMKILSALDNQKLGSNILIHDTWIDIYGFSQRLFGKRQIENFTIYKLRYGKMVAAQEFLTEEEVSERFDDMYPIIQFCEERGTPCYYVTSIASIQDDCDLPFGAIEGSHSNDEKLSRLLNEYNLNIIDLSQCATVSAIPKEELFYRTDHHWRLETCFAAYQEIIHYIENGSGFEFELEKNCKCR